MGKLSKMLHNWPMVSPTVHGGAFAVGDRFGKLLTWGQTDVD